MKNLVLAFTLLFLVVPCKAEIIIVDPNGFADFNNIQEAINYSWHGDTVIVRPGTYNENIYFNGKAITLTSENPNDPNVVGATIITANSDYSVTFDFGEGSNSVLVGFTITGEGIRCYASEPTITKNVVTQCNRGIYGQYNAAPTIYRNTVTNNSGGAVTGCNGLISYNLIAYNSNWHDGGGLRNCSGTISHNIIANNKVIGSGSDSGGGLYGCGGSIVNNTIVNNYAQSDGGAIADCDAVVLNNIIAYNEAGPSTGGGGISGVCNNQYNCFFMNEGGHFANGAFPGFGDFASDPLFANPDANDYHLKSAAGRLDPNSETWVYDDVNSPCIDAGDPCDPIGLEPNPNGGRINMGAYGGTAEASKSPSAIIEPICTEYPAMDFNKDCKVDFEDFAVFSQSWLECNLDPPSACWE